MKLIHAVCYLELCVCQYTWLSLAHYDVSGGGEKSNINVTYIIGTKSTAFKSVQLLYNPQQLIIMYMYI